MVVLDGGSIVFDKCYPLPKSKSAIVVLWLSDQYLGGVLGHFNIVQNVTSQLGIHSTINAWIILLRLYDDGGSHAR